MKVLMVGDREMYMVEVSKREFERITGKEQKAFPGEEYDVHENWNAIERIKSQQKDIANFAKRLKTHADELDAAACTFPKLPKEGKS